MKPTGNQSGVTPSSAKPSKAEAKSGTRSSKPRNSKSTRPLNTDNLLTTCEATPRLQAFTSAIGAAGLQDLLNGKGPLTIFAPTDLAFSKMPGDELAQLLNDPARVAKMVRHHVVTGRVAAPRASMPRTATPQFGDELQLTANDGEYQVDHARIVRTNIRASNGVIHAIDTVLDPG
jgi:uncharacterized surface protein with fasciclin (FAS1) repeats